jgi:hypothetical protein
MAKKYAHNKNLVFAEMDATKNDGVEVRVNSFPALKLYPGNQKTKPIDFKEKDRDEAHMIKFIKKHAHFPIHDSPITGEL